MQSKLHTWRFYGLKREEYEIAMKKVFVHNLSFLSYINRWFAVFSFSFSLFAFTTVYTNIFPEDIYRSISSGVVYIFISIIFVLASLFCKRIFGQYNKIEKYNKKIIYTFIVICYMGIMASAIHLGVFAVPNEPSIVFSIFLTSFLISITLPPTHSLLLMLVAVIVFSVSVIVFKDRFLWTLDLLNLAISIPISTAYSWHISQYRLLAALNASKLEEERNRFHTQSTIDDLTQLKNRRDFDNKFGRYLSDCREKDDFICLAIADIDHFKTYNDHYGHLGGDECLRAIGAALLEPWDNRSVYVARIGGEEFALLWFEEEKNNIQNTVLQLQKRVSGLKIPHKKSTVSEYVSLSIGVCVVRSKKEGNSQDAIYSLADKALYEAKKDGRNRIVIFDGELKY